MPVKPPLPKHRTEDLGNKLIISIPTARHWFLAIYMGLVVIAWAVSEIVLLGSFIFNPDEFGESILFFAITAIVWTVLGGLMVYQFAWLVVGKEVVEITAQNIMISRVVPSLRLPQEFSAEYIKDLRISSSNVNLLNPVIIWYFGFYSWRHDMGSLAFDYGAKTFRFGRSIDEAEAKQIIIEILQKYPQYRSNGKGG